MTIVAGWLLAGPVHDAPIVDFPIQESVPLSRGRCIQTNPGKLEKEARRSPQTGQLLYALAILVLTDVRLTSGQTEIGGAAGTAFGFSQDVTVESRDSAGNTVLVLHENTVSVRRGSIGEVGMIYWLEGHSAVGVEAEVVAWRNSIPVATWPALTESDFQQDRTAVLANLVGRQSVADNFGTYLFGGVGGGVALSQLSNTRAQLGPALSLLGGISHRIGASGWRVSLEGKYLITRDFDALVRQNGVTQNLEFSGHPSNASARPIFGPHMDSRFLGCLLGMRWMSKTG